MQLRLKRSQATKLFGGVKFELQAQATLTSEEADLIAKYKVQDEVLADKKIPIPLTDRMLVLKITIGSLVSGQTFKCNEIGDVLQYEEDLKTSCARLRQLLEVMQRFGGEEIIEFTEEGGKTISAHA